MYSIYAYGVSFHSTSFTLIFLDNSVPQFRLTQNTSFYCFYPILVEIINTITLKVY